MHHIIKKSLLVFGLGLMFFAGYSQQGNTFYYMEKVSQSSMMNPAYDPPYKVTVGGLLVPIVGQLPPTMYFNYANNGFAYSDIIHHGVGDQSDSLIYDPQKLVDNLKTSNHLRLQNHFDLLHIGLKTKNDAYVSFSITEKMNYGATLPKSLFDLAWYGNNYFKEKDEKIVLSDLSMQATHYREFAFGFSTELVDGLTIGGRAKVLFGMSNVQTDINELTLYTDPETYMITAVADVSVKSNTPVPWIYNPDSVTLDIDTEKRDDYNPVSYPFNMRNPGFGLDLGLTYEINKDFTVYFSANDIGFISWNSNPFTLSANGQFDFRGIEVEFFEDDEFDESLDNLTDSLIDMFSPNASDNGYVTWLPTDVYLGGQYHLNEKLDFGALYRMEFYRKNLLHSLTLSANSNITDWLSLYLSYSIMDNSYNNLGFGFTVRGAMLQYYIVSDNVLGAIMPQNTSNLNIRMGCNLVFGYKKIRSESLL